MSKSDAELDRIFDKFGSQCCYCGGSLVRNAYEETKPRAEHEEPPEKWAVDHWRPRALCSNDEEFDNLENLWSSCHACIGQKGDQTGDHYAEWRFKNGLALPERWVRVLGLADTQLVEEPG
jgi:hypothetical protein